ncbi:MAG TPA: AcvB/VirJ family lysyl-phosphatidylglycerol hydrolase [Steroidobacteraceae bacterium]|nr:AcvB/VirJ family lysyl-phosphatidylglycerol hydrolase [Steroidobacteraceae bacterium]
MSTLSDAVVSGTQQWVLFLVQWRLAALAVARMRCVLAPLAIVGALSLCQCTSVYTTPPSEVLSYRRFDRIYVYRPQARAQHLALLLSGDGGWSGTLGSIAERLAAGGTVVAGIDVRHLLASLSQDPATCVAPGAELESLARYLQQHYQLGPAAPVLIGHSAGATLAFVALAESRPGVFAGAITLSFCADLDLMKPLCPNPGLEPPLPRSDGVRLRLPVALPAPWIALHGLVDDVCPAADSRAYATAITTGRFVPLPDIDHGYRQMNRWWPQFEAAYRELLAIRTPHGAGTG